MHGILLILFDSIKKELVFIMIYVYKYYFKIVNTK